MDRKLPRVRLGDALIEAGLLTMEQLQEALADQKETGHKLGVVFVKKGWVTEQQILSVLASQLRVDLVDLSQKKFDPEIVKLLPEAKARRFKAILLSESDSGYDVAMSDPTDLFSVDAIEKSLGNVIHIKLAREADILSAIDRAYTKQEVIEALADELGDELGGTQFDLAQLGDDADLSEAPVVKLLQTLLEQAVNKSASDIHIEPDADVLRVRNRIDGILHEHVMNEKRVVSALVLRLKVMAGLNISEKRLPQDGRFSIKIHGRRLDVRVSTMPVVHGESVVLRLLDQTNALKPIKSLGLAPEYQKAFEQLIKRPHGMVLVTGPTGSGKTTTLYSAIDALNEPGRKIITVEDPVEYQLSRVNQVQVHHQIGLDFARVLRAVLRQDPDVVLIGEMRDKETAEIGLRAAMTGHLVFSTLHTNDAIASALRLIDMGAAPFLVAQALRGILAQRLIRKLCPKCKVIEPVDPITRARLEMLQLPVDQASLYQPKGCAHCHDTGYKGRVAVHEMLILDDEMMLAIRDSDARKFAELAHASPLYKSLMHAAYEVALSGDTSLDEVMKLQDDLKSSETELSVDSEAENALV